MTRGLVLALVLVTSSAEAAPPQTYRVLAGSAARPSPQLSTYTLTRTGTSATLDLEIQTSLNGGPWKTESKATWSGTVATKSGVTLLDLASPAGDTLSYRCKPLTVAVARSTARRVTFYRSEMNGPYGRWSPAATTTVTALLCTATSPEGEQLLFASRAIEHVAADRDCCTRPGQSLRFVPGDRSVQPALATP